MKIKLLGVIATTCAIALQIALIPLAVADTGRVFKDTIGNVYVYGLSPLSTVQIGVGVPATRQIRANSCGMVVVKPSARYPSGDISIEGVSIALANLATNTIPLCNKGTQSEARLTPFKVVGGAIAIPQKTPNQFYTITYSNQSAQHKRNSNACGFVRINNTGLGTRLGLPTTTGAIAQFALTDIPSSKPLVCRQAQVYYPSDWSSPTANSIAGSTGGSGSSGGGSTGGSGSSSGGGSTSSGGSSSGSTSSGGSNTGGSGSTGSGGSSSGGSSGGSHVITLPNGVARLSGGSVIIPGLSANLPSGEYYRLETYRANGSFLSGVDLGTPNACGYDTAGGLGGSSYTVFDVYDGGSDVVWSGNTLDLPVLGVSSVSCIDGQVMGQ